MTNNEPTQRTDVQRGQVWLDAEGDMWYVLGGVHNSFDYVSCYVRKTPFIANVMFYVCVSADGTAWEDMLFVDPRTYYQLTSDEMLLLVYADTEHVRRVRDAFNANWPDVRIA